MQNLESIFKKRGIDPRPFNQGEIYLASDLDVKIPDEKLTGRNYHEIRPVVIVTNHPLNSFPLHPRVLAAPLSHELEYQRESDLLIYAECDQVEEDCLLRLDLTQPFLKCDLIGPQGRISEERILQMLALYLHLFGVSMDDSDPAADLLFGA